MVLENEIVSVDLKQNSYQIHIGKAEFERLSALVDDVVGRKHMIVITDKNVAEHYLETVVDKLSLVATKVDLIVVEPGEQSKCISKADSLWQQLIEFEADRSSVIVALGGGVVGDLAGWVAASFMRGIPFVQLPTSLMAQVDSSVGGKTGVNLPQGKNLVGSFHQPKLVLIQTSTLSTLDDANYHSGLAEVVKYGMIMDPTMFEFLENNVEPINNRDVETLIKVIAWCCRCKASVVGEDEREISGRRAILNYGHTFGHAFENVFGYGRYLHGEAIAIGMNCAARLAVDLGMINAEVAQRQEKLLRSLKLKHSCPEEKHDEIVQAMHSDKKSSDGLTSLILPTELGRVQVCKWPGDDIVKKALLEQ